MVAQWISMCLIAMKSPMSLSVLAPTFLRSICLWDRVW